MDLIGQSDIVFHPSLEESFGNALIEGMSMGRVVVAGKDSGGCPWVLDGGSGGFLVDVLSPEAMASALIRIFRRPDEARKVAEHGRRLVEERYAASAVVARYDQIYERIAKGRDI